MSHHKNIYMMIDGEMVKIGHGRVTNGRMRVLSIWITSQQMLYLPENAIFEGEEE